MENENKNQLQIELKEEVAQGTYANLASYVLLPECKSSLP